MPNNIDQKINIEKDLILEFFFFFSRFEYALKRVGYSYGDESFVQANWDTFTNKYNDTFDTSTSKELKAAVEYLLKNPPKKQVLLDNGKLDWKEKEFSNNNKLGSITLAIRRVRNNLFHGGKFPYGPLEDPSRDSILLRHCVTILEHILGLDDELKLIFEEEM